MPALQSPPPEELLVAAALDVPCVEPIARQCSQSLPQSWEAAFAVG
jgi:hypothetical protein